jgi:hypothetical protein
MNKKMKKNKNEGKIDLKRLLSNIKKQKSVFKA